jgi:hypothetical protein
LHQIRPSQPVTAAKTAGDMADLPDMANSDKADPNYSKTIPAYRRQAQQNVNQPEIIGRRNVNCKSIHRNNFF